LTWRHRLPVVVAQWRGGHDHTAGLAIRVEFDSHVFIAQSLSAAHRAPSGLDLEKSFPAAQIAIGE
jgi:hypothetical protein